MLGMKLQRQKELDLEEVREDVTAEHTLYIPKNCCKCCVVTVSCADVCTTDPAE